MGIGLVAGRHDKIHALILDLVQGHAPPLSFRFQMLGDQIAAEPIIVTAAADLGVAHKGEAEIAIRAGLEALQFGLIVAVDKLIIISSVGLQVGNGSLVVHIAGLLIVVSSGCSDRSCIFRQLAAYQFAFLGILNNALLLALGEPGEVHLRFVCARLQKDVGLRGSSGRCQLLCHRVHALGMGNGYIGNDCLDIDIVIPISKNLHTKGDSGSLAAAGLLGAGRLCYQAAIDIVVGSDIVAEDIFRIGKFHTDMILTVNGLAGIHGNISAYCVIPIAQLHDAVLLVKANHERLANICSFHGRILVTEYNTETTLAEVSVCTIQSAGIRHGIDLDIKFENRRSISQAFQPVVFYTSHSQAVAGGRTIQMRHPVGCIHCCTRAGFHFDGCIIIGAQHQCAIPDQIAQGKGQGIGFISLEIQRANRDGILVTAGALNGVQRLAIHSYGGHFAQVLACDSQVQIGQVPYSAHLGGGSEGNIHPVGRLDLTVQNDSANRVREEIIVSGLNKEACDLCFRCCQYVQSCLFHIRLLGRCQSIVSCPGSFNSCLVRQSQLANSRKVRDLTCHQCSSSLIRTLSTCYIGSLQSSQSGRIIVGHRDVRYGKISICFVGSIYFDASHIVDQSFSSFRNSDIALLINQLSVDKILSGNYGIMRNSARAISSVGILYPNMVQTGYGFRQKHITAAKCTLTSAVSALEI